MSLTATRTADGKWAAAHAGSIVGGPFETSAEAWRWIDRYTGQPVSPSEQKAEWVFQKMADGGAA